MYAKRIDVFDEAYGNHITFAVTNNFELELFPTKNRFLYKNLAYKAGLKTSLTYNLKFLFVIYESAAGTTHGVSRTKNYGITKLICNSKCFIN